MNPFNRHSRLRENLSAYVDGELSAVDARAVEQHMETCEACRAELEGLHMASSTLAGMTAAEAPRSFALTSEMAGAPSRRPAGAGSLPALNTSLRLAAAGLAVALAAVMIVDNADFGGNGGSSDESASSALGERDLAATSMPTENLDLAESADDDDAAAAQPVPGATSAPGGVGGTTTGGGTGVGGEGVPGASPTPLPVEADAVRASEAVPGAETEFAAAPSAEPTDAAAAFVPNDDESAGAAPAAAEDRGDGGASTLELFEALLAALLGAAIGGLILLWIVRWSSPA